MMNVQRVFGGAVVLAVTVVASLWAQPAMEIPGEMTSVDGVVESIDHTRRVVTIRDTDDNFVPINVPAGAERFDEVKVGDRVSIRYYDNVIVRRKPAGEAAVDTVSNSATPAPGGQVGGTLSNQHTMTVTVSAIDRSTRAITYTGPSDFKYTRRAADTTDISTLNVGDRIDVTWTEAVIIVVNPPQ